MKYRVATLLLPFAVVPACTVPPTHRPAPPSVAPTTQPAADPLPASATATQIKPMYREVLAVDLPTVQRVVRARNLDVELAKRRVEASRANHDAAVGALFPVISPGVAYQHFGGTQQVADGNLVGSTFNNLVPGATVGWIVNPGRAAYDIVAARRRIEASEQQEYAAEIEAARVAANQYYDLVLAQAQVAVARQSVASAEESVRMTDARVRAGAAVRADDLRARAYLAARRQDLLLAVNAFYQASVALTVTLHLDPVVTLAPAAGDLAQSTLVDDALPIERLLAIAVEHRPDLAAARTLVAAAKADRKSALWAAFGPNLQATYTLAAIGTRVDNETQGLHRQERGVAGASANLSAGAVGQTKFASVNVRTTALEVERRLDQVRAQVVAAQQASLTNAALVPIAREQFAAAEEALRLTRANQSAGTMLLTDVLDAQDQLDNARFRYVQAVARYNQSQTNLLAALGITDVPVATPVGQLPHPTSPATRSLSDG